LLNRRGEPLLELDKKGDDPKCPVLPLIDTFALAG